MEILKKYLHELHQKNAVGEKKKEDLLQQERLKQRMEEELKTKDEEQD